MKHFICILFFISMLLNTVEGKIWTVDNTGRLANFTTLAAAVTAASAGDTIFLAGGGAEYPALSLSKKLCFIGPGYYLSENPGNIEYIGPASINYITLLSGSDGSVFIGITSGNITVSSNNNVIKRCRSDYIVNVTANNNILIQNFFRNERSSSETFSVTGINNMIRNNAIISYQSSASYSAITCGASNIIENNTIYGRISITTTPFGNNIQVTGTASFTNCAPYNNIGNSTQFGTDFGNQSNVNMTTVFVTTGTTDGKYQLAAGSPAIGAGQSGIDCGMYGGADPYVLSGIPDIPFFSSILIPGRVTPTNGLEIKLNIKSKK